MTPQEKITELRAKYGAPTFRQYGNSSDQWREWKAQAAALEPSEIARHASVSTSNRHECEECFCCAALAVTRELRLRSHEVTR